MSFPAFGLFTEKFKSDCYSCISCFDRSTITAFAEIVRIALMHPITDGPGNIPEKLTVNRKSLLNRKSKASNGVRIKDCVVGTSPFVV